VKIVFNLDGDGGCCLQTVGLIPAIMPNFAVLDSGFAEIPGFGEINHQSPLTK